MLTTRDGSAVIDAIMPKPDSGRESRFLLLLEVSVRMLSTFGMEKLEWCGYLTMKKNWKIRLFVSTEYMNVTDRRTPRDGIGSAYA